MKIKFLSTIILLLFLITTNAFSQKYTQTIDSLYLKYESQKEVLKKYSTFYDIGLEYLKVNLDSSKSIFNKVAIKSKTIKNDSLEVKAIIGLARVYTNQTKFDSANVYFDLAEKILNKNPHKELQQSFYINKGILFFHKSDFDSARKEFEKALEIARKEDDLDTMSRCYNNIALCRTYTGNYDEALEMHIESAKIAEQLKDDLGLAQSYNNIGLVYKDLNQFKKAEEYMLKSLELKKKEGSQIDVIGSYLNLGITLRGVGAKNKDSLKLIKARNYFNEALDLSEKTGYIRGRNNSYVNLALVETTMGNFSKGIEYGKRSLDASIESKDFEKEMISRVNLGDAYRYNKQFNLAEKQLLKGLQMSQEITNLHVKKETLLILSLLYSNKGNFKKALNYHKDYFKLTDSISSTDVKNKVHELETKYETEKKEKEILLQRADIAEKELNINQKNTQIIGLGILAVVIAVLGYLLFNQQKLKNAQLKRESELKEALVKIETQNRLQEQRLRISRDLHDNIGAQLTFIISSIDNLKYGFKITNDKLNNKLGSISDFTKDTIYELRDTIWAMNKSAISLEDLQARVSNFVDKASASADKISFNFNIDESLLKDKQFTSVEGMNIYRIIQEVVNNAIKYAEAANINVDIKKEINGLQLSITDDGIGFDEAKIESGNGLNNIKKRAQDINATITIESVLGKGTSVKLTM